jgi:ATP-dependent Clp protease adaptor protein ClpS
MIFGSKHQTEEKGQVELLEQEEELSKLVVYNDDINTFDHVINTLVSVCNHTLEQAEQCTIIIHYKGKCAVKLGSYEEMAEMCIKILNSGINAEVY